MTHLFLSDVHLGAFDESTNSKIEQSLLALINYCLEHSIQMHVLGDLFDYWMEFGTKIPDLGSNLLTSFSEYNQRFKPVTFITGNHDYWTEGYFEELGFDVQSEYSQIADNDVKIFMHHGDGLKDPKFRLPRPFFHKILRHPLFVRFYKWILSPDVGLEIMRQFSSQSRSNPSDDPERLNQWSKSFLKETNYQYIISGHDHHPRVETFPFGTYINLGTFYGDKTVGIYTNGECRLVKWDEKNRTFTPFKSDLKTSNER